MTRFIAVCDGELIADSTGFECTGEWISVDAGGIPGAFEFSQLDPALIAEYFGFGFVVTLPVMLTALGVSMLVRSPREL